MIQLNQSTQSRDANFVSLELISDISISYYSVKVD